MAETTNNQKANTAKILMKNDGFFDGFLWSRRAFYGRNI